MKIEIDYDLTLQDCYDILTSVLECGSIAYWADCVDWERDEELNILWLKIIECDERDGEEHEFTLKPEDIENGIKNIFSQDFKIAPEIRERIFEKDWDSDSDDCIIQASLFGELIYG